MMRNEFIRRRAFTLVELLAVVAIIGLLIAILVPSVNSVRKAARKTATSSGLNTLSIGLETFRTQRELGEAYPPSASDAVASNKLSYEIESPYQNLSQRVAGANHPGGNRFRISGAGLLYMALIGADGLGTAGFRPIEGEETWGDSLSDRAGGLYEIPTTGPKAGQPQAKRYGPFVDPGSLSSSEYRTDKQRFSIPLEDRTRETGDPPLRNYPMFVDGFGAPVLYWRADRAGQRIADKSPNDVTGSERGIYHFEDNGALLAAGSEAQDETNLQLGSARTGQPFHDLDMDDTAASIRQADFLNSSDRDNSFARHILDVKVTARAQPQNADKYILLSPGPDLIYGTTDDIGNFEPNGGLK
jgi:prepilin-type N-terminal cleavage/methylation domain-containing protein